MKYTGLYVRVSKIHAFNVRLLVKFVRDVVETFSKSDYFSGIQTIPFIL